MEYANLSTRRFGLELEFQCHNQSGLELQWAWRRRLPGLPLSVTGYEPSNPYIWTLKPDSSCGLEITSPAITWARWSEVLSVLEWMRMENFEINANCSVHVHHEFRGVTATRMRRLVWLWAAVEPLFMAACKINRTNSPYCEPLTAWYGIKQYMWHYIKDDFRQMRPARRVIQSMGRRRGLNLTSYWRQGTAEFRTHHGSTDADEILWWTLMTQVVVELSFVDIREKTLHEIFNISSTAELLNRFQTLVLKYFGNVEPVRVAVGQFEDRINRFRPETFPLPLVTVA